MSGTRRLIVGELAQGKLKGRALSDALAQQLNSQDSADGAIKRKISKTYGKNTKKK